MAEQDNGAVQIESEAEAKAVLAEILGTVSDQLEHVGWQLENGEQIFSKKLLVISATCALVAKTLEVFAHYTNVVAGGSGQGGVGGRVASAVNAAIEEDMGKMLP